MSKGVKLNMVLHINRKLNEAYSRLSFLTQSPGDRMFTSNLQIDPKTFEYGSEVWRGATK